MSHRLLRLGLAVVALFGGVGLEPSIAAPDEEALGRSAGYPVGTARTWFYDEKARVGSFSHLDSILPHNTLRKSPNPLPLPKAATAPALGYRFENQQLTIDDFLQRQRITGLLVIKNGQVLVERYQYDRTAAHRFVSNSMSKTITAIAIGLALAEKRITSLDDPASKYATDIKGSGYGETTIRNLLRMSSGVKFTEVYDGKDDVARYSRTRAVESTAAALKLFTAREAPQGSRFHYASAETAALAMVLRGATGQSLSAYLTSRLWHPMGAEADATWIVSRDGLEIGGGSFNAILRDYGRLGVLFANDGAVGDRQVLPKDYLLDMTDWKRQPAAFHPAKATPYFGYGYQTWLYPGEKRRFALLGVYGQSIFVDPELKLVLVITAVAKNASVGKETLARERDALWRGLVGTFGRW